MFIREIGTAELMRCVGVLNLCYAKRAHDFGLTDYNSPADGAFITLERLIFEADNGYVLIGAFDGDELVGLCEFEKFERECVISKICVLPERRRQGIGASLLSFAIGKAKELGYKTITASLIDDDKPVKAWFLSKGFEVDAIRNYPTMPYTVCRVQFIMHNS